MSDTPFLGELRLMSCNFNPRGWATCNGQLLPINQNQALFSLLGTMYGGDGEVNFALPDLRGRTPMHRGGGWVQGQQVGEEFHALTQSEIPVHDHQLTASSRPADQAQTGMLASAGNTYRGVPGNVNQADLTPLHPSSVATLGGGHLHENRQPALVLTWCVALIGIFPSET